MNETRSFYRKFELEELAKLRTLDLKQLREYQPIREFELGKSGQSYLLPNEIVRKPYDPQGNDKLEREVWALTALDPYPFFPKILKVDNDENCLYMTYVGDRIYEIAIADIPDDYIEQLEGMVDALETADVFHHDIHLYHITLHHNRLHLIDFGRCCTHKEASLLKSSGALNLWYSDVSYIRDLVARHFEAIKGGSTSKLPVS
jgi:predicted Ser/Thr protein kinase